MNTKYKTLSEAQAVANIENMGRDYSTVRVFKEGDYYILRTC